MEFSSKFWDKKYCNSELPQLQLIVHSFIQNPSRRNPISDVETGTGHIAGTALIQILELIPVNINMEAIQEASPLKFLSYRMNLSLVLRDFILWGNDDFGL
jgi:hypothetical protein